MSIRTASAASLRNYVIRFIKRLFWNSQESRLPAFWRVTGQFIAFVIFLFISVILYTLVLGPPPETALLLQILVTAPLFISIYVSVRFLDRRAFSDLGLKLSKLWWADLMFGLVLGGGLISGVFGVELVAGWVEVTATLQTTEPDQTFAASIGKFTLLFICAGFSEELLSRGYHLRNMAEGFCCRFISPRIALLMALLLSSFLFSIMHLANTHITLFSICSIILAGMLLGLPYLLTGRLALPIGLHTTWNLFQGSVFGFSVSGNKLPASVLTTSDTGPDVWTGGEFGPEGGLLGIVAMVIGCLLILMWVRFLNGKISLQTQLAQYQNPRTRPIFRPTIDADPAPST